MEDEMSKEESKVGIINALKVEIFDILREQETLRNRIDEIQKVKQQKVQELNTLESEIVKK